MSSGAFRKGGRRGRTSRRLPPKPLILIVCEGLKTEPLYFHGIRIRKRIPETRIKIVTSKECNGTDPLTLVRCAKDVFEEMKADGLVYDEIWVVFDHDDHQTIEQAMDMAKGNSFNVAFSNPCFELWYLLHYDRQTAHIHRVDCAKQLRATGRLDGYVKGRPSVYEELRHLQSTAIENARHLRERHDNNGDLPTSNPSTTVDLLVEFLEKINK